MHRARFMGKRMVKRYTNHRAGWLDEYRTGSVYSYWKPMHPDVWADTNLLYEGELDEPILHKGEMIYIHTIKKSAGIENVFRSTDGTYTYLTNHVIEEIEDEETLRSKEEAEKIHKEYQELQEGIVLPRSEPIYIQEKSWFERLFK